MEGFTHTSNHWFCFVFFSWKEYTVAMWGEVSEFNIWTREPGRQLGNYFNNLVRNAGAQGNLSWTVNYWKSLMTI